MSFVAVAIGGSAVLGLGGAIIGSNAAQSAANTQAQSAQNALNFQQGVFGQQQQNYNNAANYIQGQAANASDYIKQNYAPFVSAGQGATNTLSQLASGNFSSFTNSPDYQFALDQGTRGVTNYENAQGMGMSGGALKDIAQFNQGLATQQYGNYFNRLMQIATLGGNAAGNASGNIGNLAGSSITGMGNLTGGFNTAAGNMSNSIGNTIQGIGQAQASGTVGAANAWMGGLNGVGQNAILGAALGKSNPSAYSSGSSGIPSAIQLGNNYYGPLGANG